MSEAMFSLKIFNFMANPQRTDTRKQEEPDILCTRLIWLAYANPRSTRPAGNWLTPIMLPKSFLRFAQKLLCSDMKNKRGASFFRNLRLIRLAMN